MFNGEVVRIREPGTSFSVGIKVPEYIIDFVKFIDKQENDYRIIALPSLPLNGYRWGYVGPPHLLTLLSSKSILSGTSNATDTDKLKNTYYNALYERTTPLSSKILDVLNVKYILVHNDAWYDFFGSQLSPDFLKSALSYQRKINLLGTFGQWQLYQNQDDPVYIGEASSLAMLVGEISAFFPLSYISSGNDLPIILSNQKINHPFIEKEINNGIKKFIFYNATFSDVMFDFMEAKHKITITNKAILNNDKLAFNLDAELDAVYQVWLKKDIYDVYKRKLNVKINDRDIKDEKKLIQDDFSSGWINIVNFDMKKGMNTIELCLSQQEKNLLGPRSIGLIVLSEDRFNAYNDQYCNSLSTCFKEGGKSLVYLLSSEKMQSKVVSENTQWENKSNSPKLTNVFQFKENQEETKWNWLLLDNEQTIFINNQNPEEVLSNIQFDVLSYEINRSLYYNVNGVYYSMSFVPKNTAITVILKDIKLKTGDNYITLYSPDTYSYKDRRSVTCALKDVVIGNEYYKSEFYIPKSGNYNIRIYPSDDLIYDDKQKKNIKVNLDSNEIVLDLNNLGGINVYALESASLSEGLHSIGFAQMNMGKYCLEVSTENDTQEFSHPLNYKKINRTNYRVSQDSNKESFLYFREAYNPEWEANIINHKSGKKSKLENHFIVDGYANGWKIDCPGHGQASTIIINYKIQNLFYLGLSISLITFIISIFYLCYDYQRKGSRKK